MHFPVILISTVSLISAQSCPCESSSMEFTELYFKCPIDNFCSDSLISGSCGKTCHPSGSFHSSPFNESDPSIILGSPSCLGPLIDLDKGGAPMCAYSNPSAVLTTSTFCNVPIFNCDGCDSSKIRYFDYGDKYLQISCESGLIQYTYADNSAHEYDYRLYLNKKTCVVTRGREPPIAPRFAPSPQFPITSISCKTQPYEIDACIDRAGSPSGLTGHCHFGTCWLYCQDNTKQLSFIKGRFGAQDGFGARIETDYLVCESITDIQYGQYSAFRLECRNSGSNNRGTLLIIAIYFILFIYFI